MNNDNNLNLHSKTQLSGGLRYCCGCCWFRFFCRFRTMSALSAAIFVMSLPNNCFPAFGNDASARKIFEGFIGYRNFDLRNTEIEFAAFPIKQIARSAKFSNSSCDNSCLLSSRLWRASRLWCPHVYNMSLNFNQFLITVFNRFLRHLATTCYNKLILGCGSHG